MVRPLGVPSSAPGNHLPQSEFTSSQAAAPPSDPITRQTRLDAVSQALLFPIQRVHIELNRFALRLLPSSAARKHVLSISIGRTTVQLLVESEQSQTRNILCFPSDQILDLLLLTAVRLLFGFQQSPSRVQTGAAPGPPGSTLTGNLRPQPHLRRTPGRRPGLEHLLHTVGLWFSPPVLLPAAGSAGVGPAPTAPPHTEFVFS